MDTRRVVVLALLLGGCIPDLSAWEIAQAGADGGTPPGVDAANPIELGTPCPNPHILVSTVTNSGTARLMRFDPANDNARCRDSELLEVQGAFGRAIYDVDWHPDTGVLLGLSDAVLGLDDAGFPAWRHDPFERSEFNGGWVAAFGSGAETRIAVGTGDGTGIDAMWLLHADGTQRTDIEPPFFAAVMAAHPDGSRRLLLPSRSSPELDVHPVDDATTDLPDEGTPLWTAATDLPATYGYRRHIAVDLSDERVLVTFDQGLAFGTATAAPTSVVGCSTECESFHAAALGPGEEEAYAICQKAGTRHLVHVQGGSCHRLIDGTGLGGHTLQDVTLVRAPL